MLCEPMSRHNTTTVKLSLDEIGILMTAIQDERIFNYFGEEDVQRLVNRLDRAQDRL